MSKWNLVAMGQVGLTGWTKRVAQPVARSIARRTGRSEPEILAAIGAAILVSGMLGVLRTIKAVVTAGRSSPSSPEGVRALR
jgi:hypothetical protein